MRFPSVAVQEHYDAKNMALVTYEPPASVYEPLVTEQSDAQMTSADFDAWVHKVLHKAVSHSEAVRIHKHCMASVHHSCTRLVASPLDLGIPVGLLLVAIRVTCPCLLLGCAGAPKLGGCYRLRVTQYVARQMRVLSPHKSGGGGGTLTGCMSRSYKEPPVHHSASFSYGTHATHVARARALPPHNGWICHLKSTI